MGIFSFALVIAISLALVLWRALVLQILWGWFIIPFGAPNLSLAWAIGLMLVIGLWSPRYKPRGDKNDGLKDVGYLIIAPLISLAVGWVVHRAMI